MNDRLGFLSVSGVLVAGVALVVVLGWTMIAGPVAFSPGALSSRSKGQTLGGVTSHAQLAGDCGACHAAPWSSQTMADRCMACHTDVSVQIQAKRGLHGILVGRLTSPTCRGCHMEHHGPDGALTIADPATFPHDLTGYSLRGHQHKANGAPFICTDCHPKDLAHFDQATCAGCHAAIDATFMARHEADFGKECLQCHNGSDPFGANFGHSFFPLDHGSSEQRATCRTCHPTGFRAGFRRYTCFGCHAHTPAGVQAQHEGQSAAQLTDCIRCHPGGRKGD